LARSSGVDGVVEVDCRIWDVDDDDNGVFIEKHCTKQDRDKEQQSSTGSTMLNNAILLHLLILLLLLLL
jgi:hypothetical protein